MKYFIDTEFIEGFHKPLFGKRRHFIDLISIGIVAEDGREYYAISNEFRAKDADEWVKDNVISKIENELYKKLPWFEKSMNYNNSFNKLQKRFGKSNKKIAQEIKEFICSYGQASEYAGCGSIDEGYEAFLKVNKPDFYAYYADYDWVLFCSLFGRMIDLPKGFPMYCNDLKQMIHEYSERLSIYQPTRYMYGDVDDTPEIKYAHLTSCRAYEKLKSGNEHNALEDARFNKRLYDYLQTRKFQ